MARKKLHKFLALAMATCISIPTGFANNLPLYAKATTNTTETTEDTDENVFKVEFDETGTIVADNSTSLEDQKFSWDNATVYFVLTDRFLNSDKSNDHAYGRGKTQTGADVAGLDTYTNPGTFHGGDLNGLTTKVEEGYFNDLGVNAIWITAPYEQIHGFTSGNKQSNNANTYPDPAGGGFPYYSYHGYWTLDYTNIDENMGTEEDFGNFVDTCHKHGIRVVMDVVMNHVGYTTMQDAVDYGFDGALKGDWATYYYGNATSLMGGDPESENYWDKSSSAWSKWWGPGFVRSDYPSYTAAGGDDITMSLCGLPDVMTESSAPEVATPPLLVTKWTQEGRLSQEQNELNDYFSRTGNKKQARYYITKWLTDWVREYGVDGFRCDTAKHVHMDAWNDLKTEAVSALKEWRINNPTKAGAQWTDDFWMTGEAWGHGMGRSSYYDNGFDSMINFTFPKSGDPASMEGTYSDYAAAINSDPTFNSLSYISSHDDCLTRTNLIGQGTCLLLAPGGVQIYYGDETNRPLGWNDWFTSDYTDQRYRTDMNWTSIDDEVLSHWKKVGSFRNKHVSVGAGQHEMLSESPYTFSRTYNLEEDDEDKVVVSVPGKAGACTVDVGDVFEDGETITDYYTGEKYEVSSGSVSVTAGENGVVLLEGSGIVKASVSAKTAKKATTYSTDQFEITLRANKAKDTYYSINGGSKVAYKADDVLTIGGDTAYEEETTLTLYGVSEDDGSELTKEYTYARSKEPTVSDGQFALKVKKSDFATAPTVFIYTNDTAETSLAGAWPGTAMTEDPDSDEYWVYSDESITDEVRFILVSGSWRSTADKAPGLLAGGCMLYDKTTGELEELPSGEPGKVIINYVDTAGNELKSIYRVGVVDRAYTTYAANIEGYEIVETPSNATGKFTAEDTVVTYVYSNDPNASISTPTPTASSPNASDNNTINTPTPNNNQGNNNSSNSNAGNSGDNNTLTTSAPDNSNNNSSNNNSNNNSSNNNSNNNSSNNNSSNNNSNNNSSNNNNSNNNSNNNNSNNNNSNNSNNNNNSNNSNNSNNTATSTPPSVNNGANTQTTSTPNNTGSTTQTTSSPQPGNNSINTGNTITIEHFSANSISPQKVDTKITLSAKGNGGSGSYQYRFYAINVENPSDVIELQAYSTKNSTTWQPTKAATYKVTVQVKDASNSASEVSQSMNFSVVESDDDTSSNNSSDAKKATVTLKNIKVKKFSGKILFVNAKATTSSGTLKYKLTIKNKNTNKTVKTFKYSTDNAFVVQLKKSGNYKVILSIKNSNGASKSYSRTIKIK